MRKTVLLAVAAFAAPLFLLAQPKWEAGLSGGFTNYFGDFNLYFLPPWTETHPAGNAYVRYNLNHSWSIRGNYLYGKLSGNDSNYGSRKERGFSFNSTFSEIALLAEWDAHGKYRFSENGFNNILSSYFFAGPCVGVFNTTTNYNIVNGQNPAVDINKIEADRDAANSKPIFAGIMGGGAKYDLNQQIFFNVEAGLRPTVNDLIDGVSRAGNQRVFDWYFYIGLGAGIRIVPGDPDTDRDGVADSRDECPKTIGLSQFNGCPDSDGDGVPDRLDACPNERGSTAMRGCPFVDSDSDGVPDENDKCPNETGVALLFGCPDSDRDGISDYEDLCPDLAGSAEFKGCPNGQRTVPPVLLDKDQDGIEDQKDKCPDIAGRQEWQGCPEMDAADKKAIEIAAKNIQFEPNTDILTEEAKIALDRISAVLVRYPGHKVVIEAHTDNVGSESANQNLSERRASRSLEYLKQKGVSAQNLQAQGFGESRPLAENNSAEGRKLNRRVVVVIL